MTSVNVTKVWNDGNNRDGFRTEITVKLYANNVFNQSFVLNEANNWRHTFDGLFVYANGEKINYSVVEEGVDSNKYTVVVSNDTMYDFTITNTHVPEVTSVNVTKVWNDDNDRDGMRPVSVVVNLLADGKINQTVVLNASNSWKYTFANLLVYKDGKKIKYNFSEEVVDKYTVSYDNNTVDNFIIINTHVPEVTGVNVTKVWDDDGNRDGVRPVSVVVNLLADGVIYQTVELNESNNWAYYFTDLYVYKDGKKIKYNFSEVVVDKYTVSYDNKTVDNFIIINTHVPEVTSVNVTKVWNDDNNRDGLRSEITVELYANGVYNQSFVLTEDNGWKHVFSDLFVYVDGVMVNYTVREVGVNAAYSVDIVNDTLYDFTIINTHVPEVTGVNVTKVWNDYGNYDGVRPVNVTVVLLADGNVVDYAVLGANNNWSAYFAGLPVYNQGAVIKYSIDEVSVFNYTVEITNSTAYNFIVTNTHVPVVIDINVTKVWIDANNQDGLRPDKVTVVLYGDSNMVGTAILDVNNNWSASFKNLPVYYRDKLIEYSVEEISVADYTSEIFNEDGYRFVVVNSHAPIIKVINITKVSKDNDELSNKTVDVIIYSDGEIVANVTLFPDDWSVVFEKFPYYKDGKVINYTITVVGENNYTVDITPGKDNLTNITIDVYPSNPDMSVDKISLNKTVNVGEQVSFVIVVKNTGDCDLTGVYVIEDEYSEGIVLDHMLPNSDWIFDGISKFTYGKTLGRGQSANFTVIFNTTSVGFKFNHVIAGNNNTNKTVNSTNTTNVTNNTVTPNPVPPIPVHPTPEPPISHKHHVPKHVKSDSKATGNPIALLLLALFIPLIRRKQK